MPRILLAPSLAPRPAMSAKRAAEILGCDLSLVYRRLRERKLQGYRDGRAIRIFIDSIASYQQAEPLGGAEIPAPKRRPAAIPGALNEAMARLRADGLL